MHSETSQHGARSDADTVRLFYEQHPYPPPVRTLDGYRKSWDTRERRRVEAHLFWPTEVFREDRCILVAGCGTSQAAKYAMRWPKAEVIGIDVSTTSVESTVELKRKYGLDNLQVERLEIENVRKLGRDFDFIVSTGVVHHLPDPHRGLAALGRCLQPKGAMHFMVYAPYGRAGIYMIQEYCSRLGIGTTIQEIRDLAASLAALPRDHPLVPILQNSPDFKTESALADALLHPQDRAYSVDQLFGLVEHAGLAFGRWIRQAPYLAQCGALTQVPHSASMVQLSEQEQFAAMELFRGNMLRHSAILLRPDPEQPTQPISFDDDAWLDYVPLRASGTINVKEKLPAGTAAVLINQAHTQTDIYLPINALQEQMVERIDGMRTIRQIFDHVATQAEARTLFQRLWWYDQVVFDASGAGDAASKGTGER